MPRVKRGVTARARHKKVLALAKGFRGRRGNVFRIAKEAVMKAGQYAYRDRRTKKRVFRQLWIARINAAARELGMTYSAFINGLNREWVEAAARVSPRLLIDLTAFVGTSLADFVERFPDDGPALFPVSWAGEAESQGWFDLGREFTEQWHHQAQIREAVGAPPLSDPIWLHSVLLIALRGLPHAYRDTFPVFEFS
jgi:large subunit ribosomal protein L20